MEVDSTEWDAICRICLQEGTLHSIFDFDDEKSELNIAEKIMLCSPIEVNWRFSIFFYFDFRDFWPKWYIFRLILMFRFTWKIISDNNRW